jgi:hypothetical protein
MNRSYSRAMADAVLQLVDDLGSASTVDLARMTNRTPCSIRGSLRLLRNRKKVYISRYERQVGTGGRSTPFYALGEGPDVPEPEQISRKVINQRYNKRRAAIISTKARVRRGTTKSIWAGLGART